MTFYPWSINHQQSLLVNWYYAIQLFENYCHGYRLIIDWPTPNINEHNLNWLVSKNWLLIISVCRNNNQSECVFLNSYFIKRNGAQLLAVAGKMFFLFRALCSFIEKIMPTIPLALQMKYLHWQPFWNSCRRSCPIWQPLSLSGNSCFCWINRKKLYTRKYLVQLSWTLLPSF